MFNLFLFFFLWHFTGIYGIYIKAQPSLSYDTARQYTLTISCTDTKDTAQGSFIVYVTRNNPPTFDNLQGNYNVLYPSSLTPVAAND